MVISYFGANMGNINTFACSTIQLQVVTSPQGINVRGFPNILVSSLKYLGAELKSIFWLTVLDIACERRRISGCRDSLRRKIMCGENLDSRKYVCIRRLCLT